MRILVVGGGPAGLYFALLMKQRDPRHEIRVVERAGPHDTFGWGIVFSDQTHMEDDMGLEPVAFAYRLMTRSGRIDREKLRKRDPEFVAAYESESR